MVSSRIASAATRSGNCGLKPRRIHLRGSGGSLCRACWKCSGVARGKRQPFPRTPSQSRRPARGKPGLGTTTQVRSLKGRAVGA